MVSGCEFSSSARTSSAQTPDAFTTDRVVMRNVAPVMVSRAVTTWLVRDGESIVTTSQRLAMVAPLSAAVRSTETTSRASSASAS